MRFIINFLGAPAPLNKIFLKERKASIIGLMIMIKKSKEKQNEIAYFFEAL